MFKLLKDIYSLTNKINFPNFKFQHSKINKIKKKNKIQKKYSNTKEHQFMKIYIRLVLTQYGVGE